MQEGRQTGYNMSRLDLRDGGDVSLNGSLVVGLLAASLVVVSGLMTSSQPLQFINVHGLLIVLGGTVASTLIQFSLSDLRGAVGALQGALRTPSVSARERMGFLLELSHRVREKGILVVDEEAESESEDFFRLGLMLVADGRPIDDIKRILGKEMQSSREREWRSVQVWETMGNFAPAMGLIGTLLGLIQMLGSLQDPGTTGPSMAMALVATLYGSVGANLLFFPIAGKLRVLSQEREQCKSVTLEGLLSIARLENPIMLEQRLQSFASMVMHG